MKKINFPSPGEDWGTIRRAYVGNGVKCIMVIDFPTTFQIEDKPLPKTKVVQQLEDARKRAVKAHRAAHMAIYVREPVYTWVGNMCRINSSAGVTIKRLKQLTKGLEQQRRNA